MRRPKSVRLDGVPAPLASGLGAVLGEHHARSNSDVRHRDRAFEQMANLARAYGRKVATADEARAIMQVGTWYNSVDETLPKLGLPPNRAEGQPGFLVWKTTGKKRAQCRSIGFTSDGLLHGAAGAGR
jgi:hypothetical protein